MRPWAIALSVRAKVFEGWVVVHQRLPARREKWRGFSCPPDGGRTVIDEVAGAAVLVGCFGQCGTTPAPQVPVRASGRL